MNTSIVEIFARINRNDFEVLLPPIIEVTSSIKSKGLLAVDLSCY